MAKTTARLVDGEPRSSALYIWPGYRTLPAGTTLQVEFNEGPNSGELTVRPGSDVGVGIEAIPGAGIQLPGCSAGRQLLGYRVQLEVAADAQLPA